MDDDDVYAMIYGDNDVDDDCTEEDDDPDEDAEDDEEDGNWSPFLPSLKRVMLSDAPKFKGAPSKKSRRIHNKRYKQAPVRLVDAQWFVDEAEGLHEGGKKKKKKKKKKEPPASDK
eukprot:3126931-Prymnesium_polylepis.1